MKYAINLLPQKEAPLVEKLMYFSLNYLRYIIVITQLVVIGVFFYRFQIDQRIIDLKESVDQKKEIVQVVSPLLKEAEIISKRTTASNKIIGEQKQFIQMIDYLLSVFPTSVTLTNLQMDGSSFQITGIAFDLKQFQAFYQLLQTDKRFKTVSLMNVKRTESGYGFDLKLTNFQSK